MNNLFITEAKDTLEGSILIGQKIKDSLPEGSVEHSAMTFLLAASQVVFDTMEENK